MYEKHMQPYTLVHVSSHELLDRLTTLVAEDRANSAVLLAHLAEVEARRLDAPAGYASMFDYCVRVLAFSEDMAYKRIRAARLGRKFPIVFEAVADGRLHVSGIVALYPFRKHPSAGALLADSYGKTRAEIERMLSGRFPTSDLIPWVQPVAAAVQLAPGPVETGSGGSSHSHDRASADRAVEAQGPAPVVKTNDKSPPSLRSSTTARSHGSPGSTVKPAAPQRYALQVTVAQGTYEKLEQARSLLRHQVPSGDLAEVLDRALEALVQRLQKRKFAATDQPRKAAISCEDSAGTSRHDARANAPAAVAGEDGPSVAKRPTRYIPAKVRRVVRERDEGRCTYLSPDGRRCGSRDFIQFDHATPFARGGEATADNLRLRCRAHNQLAADRAFGRAFMERRRSRGSISTARHA